jgi:large subunit ribosomal protein L29
MKASQLRDLSVKELAEKVGGWEEELFNLRFQAKLGQLGNPLRLHIVRRDIAKAKTIISKPSVATTSLWRMTKRTSAGSATR